MARLYVLNNQKPMLCKHCNQPIYLSMGCEQLRILRHRRGNLHGVEDNKYFLSYIALHWNHFATTNEESKEPFIMQCDRNATGVLTWAITTDQVKAQLTKTFPVVKEST